MLRTKLFLAGLSGLALAASASAQLPNAAALFGAREDVEDIDISPDGNSVVFISGGRTSESIVQIARLDGEVKRITSSSGKPERAYWCNWATADRLVCRIGGVSSIDGLKVGFSRLLSVSTDGKDARELGQRSSFYDLRPRQFDGDVLDWLPQDGKAVLMAREYVPEGRPATRLLRTSEGLGIDKVDLRTGKVDVIEAADRTADRFISDGRGSVRIRQVQSTQSGGQQMGSRTTYYYRKKGSKAWEELGSYDSMTRQGMIPLAVDADLDATYVLKKLNGRFALYRVKLDGSNATELVYANDRVDVDNVVRVGRGQKVIGVTFAEEKRQTVYFDEEYKRLAGTISRSLPNLPLVRFAGASADGRKLLIFAGSDADPGRYYIYDKQGPKLSEIILVRPQLEGVKLASVKPVSYPAADGVQVPGYLTLPPGKEQARGLPAVVLPHGGPSARDEWGFDWLAQYLASQGFAVLQPNYRGSDGFGDAWLQQNGFRSWQTSIGDVTSGAKWLVSQGIADPAKLAIVGWSYGGYAALQSAVVEPDLYKAVVAIAPVTDLNMVKQDASQFTNAALVAQFVGDGPHVRQGSPLQNAERIRVPVLMFHGDQDINVGVGQARAMDSKLKGLGKKSELVVFPGLEHSLVDSSARTQTLEKIGAFLAAATK
jgi:dipeptidyl aminopeptidase/acylaminoacyl peptidase